MAAALTPDQLGAIISPAAEQTFAVVWMIVKLILWATVFIYGILLYRYNRKLIVRQYSKGGRVIAKVMRGRRFIDSKTNSPKIQFFGTAGFGGRIINEPPSECIIPHKGMFTKIMYDMIEKDGLFYPVQNTVLGKRYEVLNPQTKQNQIVYSVDGSGLEISRDYDSEQAIQNNLIDYATKYRNKKPIEIAAMYGLMIVVIIGSIVVMVYGWKQFGNMAGAIASLNQPLQDGITQAISQKLGPG